MKKTNIIKRHFYNKVDYILLEDEKRVKLLPHFFQQLKNKQLWNKFGFKKIGGSILGDVLQLNQYASQFNAFCSISWIGLPILDKKYVNAGIVIEPKVIDLLEKALSKELNKEVKIKRYDPTFYDYDVFKDKSEIVGGIPDGYLEEKNTIIEIKTTNITNLENWKKYGVPANYKRQAQLYAYLMGVPYYTIIATFLEEKDYENPELFDINNRIVVNYKLQKVDQSQVLDDIEKATKWYKQVTTNGISPKWDESLDQFLIKWLRCENLQEWEELKKEWKILNKYVE